ncbi:MerR family transcriptional regulator [Streptomyces brevispora]|uniref:MerR family transcriptional regulator n=1 Tax=Streptomyces brevispora TaxID=887462 RepID=UPI0035DDEEB1
MVAGGVGGPRHGEGSVERVEQIRALLKAGLGTEVIREIVPCFQGAGSEVRPIVDAELVTKLTRELADIEERIDTLPRNRDAIRCYLAEAAGGEGRHSCHPEDEQARMLSAPRRHAGTMTA